MSHRQLLRDYSKIIATMRRIFGDFKFVEEQRMMRQFINRDDPFQAHFLMQFIAVFVPAVDYTTSVEDARIMQLIIRLLMDYISRYLMSNTDEELCDELQEMKIQPIALRYAHAERNFVQLQISKLLNKRDQKTFFRLFPHLKNKYVKKGVVDANLDDSNEARFNLKANLSGLKILIQKELIATWKEFSELESEFCESNNFYYCKADGKFLPPVLQKLNSLLHAFQMREFEHHSSVHVSYPTYPRVAATRTSSDDHGENITFELDNPLLAQSSDDEEYEMSMEREGNPFEVIEDGQLEFDFHTSIAGFGAETALQRRMAVVALEGEVLLFLQKTVQILEQRLPASYQNGVIFMIRIVSSLINYTYYYSYTRLHDGFLDQLLRLEETVYYTDVEKLIQRLNEELILNDRLESWQKLFMPAQRGYISTQFSIISNCVNVIHAIMRASFRGDMIFPPPETEEPQKPSIRLSMSGLYEGDSYNAQSGEFVSEDVTEQISGTRVEFWNGFPSNALQDPINLNHESAPIFVASSFESIYRPYFTKQTVNVLVIMVQTLTQELLQYTLEARLQAIQPVFPETVIFDQVSHCLRCARFSEEFLQISKAFECESFGFLEIERQFHAYNQQLISKYRSSSTKETVESSSLSTHSIIHARGSCFASPGTPENVSELRTSRSEQAHFSALNQPEIEDFEPVSYIARGGFGCVILVRYVRTGALMAMKIMRKSDIIRKNQVDRIRMEKEILENIQAQRAGTSLKDFVVSFYGSFRSSRYLFLLLEYMQYGSLSELLSACGAFPEATAQHYIAELALALALMHSENIIYNDLKPENLLITSRGHVKFTDFGLSNAVISEIQPSRIDDELALIEEAYAEGSEPSRPELTEEPVVEPKKEQEQRIVGTPNYLAPELLCNRNPTAASDFWSLGVCLYEFLYGCKPFHGQSAQEIFLAELEREPEYYDEVSPEAIDLMKELLQKSPEKRLHTIEQLKDHPFFAEFEFAGVLERKGPYIPSVKYEGQQSMIKTASENWIDEIIKDSGLIEDLTADLIGTQSDDKFSGYSFYRDGRGE